MLRPLRLAQAKEPPSQHLDSMKPTTTAIVDPKFHQSAVPQELGSNMELLRSSNAGPFSQAFQHQTSSLDLASTFNLSDMTYGALRSNTRV